MAINKSQFIMRTIAIVTTLAQSQETIAGLSGVFTARGYQTGGANAISDADLAAANLPISAAQFNSIVVPLLVDYLNFCSNVAVAAHDRKSDLNLTRNDI